MSNLSKEERNAIKKEIAEARRVKFYQRQRDKELRTLNTLATKYGVTVNV